VTAVYVEEGPDKGAIWHFGEPNKEQRALLEGKAWADLSHLSIVAVSGADRLKWLHDLTTQYLLDLQAGQWLPAMILDPQGHVEFQFNLVDDGSTTWLVIDPGYVQGLIEYLQKMKFMLRVEVQNASAEYAVFRAPGLPTDIGGPLALVPRSEIIEMEEAFGTAGIQIGTWALDAERVAAGRPRHGIDTDFKTIPNELGVLNNAVHMAKGCYRGQETVKRHYAGYQAWLLTDNLKLDSAIRLKAGRRTPVMNGDVQVGFLGTVARHHELGPIALALVKRTTPVDAQLMVGGVAASQQIIVEA